MGNAFRLFREDLVVLRYRLFRRYENIFSRLFGHSLIHSPCTRFLLFGTVVEIQFSHAHYTHYNAIAATRFKTARGGGAIHRFYASLLLFPEES
jgi:hypothetical protein